MATKKDVYGAIIASLLFWRDMSSVLGSWGFEPNTYASCVMNKTVYRKYCTIFWHVYDLKILHMIKKLVNRVLLQLTDKYGKVSALSVS